jgi:acetyl esterase/lipase
MNADDVAKLLDAEIASFFAKYPPMVGTISADTLKAARDTILTPPYEPSGTVTIEEHVVPADDDEPALTIRVHRPNERPGESGASSGDADLPCIVWMHGGGLVMGTAAGADAQFDTWCARHRMVAVSVEYRLAPETPYPGPLEDCYRALRYVHRNAPALGIDRTRIGIGGASAGGGLAAGLGLLARDRGEFPVFLQLLVYPMIDDRRTTASSSWEVPVWNPPSNSFGWTSYLPGIVGGPQVPAYAAAARAEDLRELAPTYIMVGGLDLFVDEDTDYARRLIQAGVPTELHVYPGCPHAFELFAPHTTIATRARRDLAEWLDARLGHQVVQD